MFLSKVIIRSKIRNPYDIHRRLWELFPDTETRRPFLYRIESATVSGGIHILMQSEIQPMIGTDKTAVAASRELILKLRPGQRLRFLVCANPVKRLDEERCRVPLIREDQQKEWLKRKTDSAADVSEPFAVNTNPPIYFRKQGIAGKIATATFTGILCVSDVDRFVSLVRQGIGPAKSFGCGMISLAGA